MVVTAGFPKRNEGRDEPIVDPQIPIIDTHHHLFDRPALRYMLDDYLAHARLGHRIIASVYIETQAFARAKGDTAMKPVGEVEFAAGVGAMADSGTYGETRVAAAMVGFADMTLGAGIAPFLDKALAIAPERFRGVRQIALAHPDPAVLKFLTHKPPPDLLKSDGFRAALDELQKRNLSFDVTVLHNQIPELIETVRLHPGMTFVLDHLGMALARDGSEAARAEAFGEWRRNIRALAELPNVFCKIGGLGTSYWRFPQYMREAEVTTTAELVATWGPYVETALEAFGAGRCMAESNFPNDGRSAGFVPLWNALKTIVRGCSRDEKAAFFHGTAISAYRIEGVEIPQW